MRKCGNGCGGLMLTSTAFFDGSILTRKAVSQSLELSFLAGLLASLFWALIFCLLTHLDHRKDAML